jgi:hypothetical protein
MCDAGSGVACGRCHLGCSASGVQKRRSRYCSFVSRCLTRAAVASKRLSMCTQFDSFWPKDCKISIDSQSIGARMHALACRERWALPSSGFTVAHDCSEYHLIVHVAPRCSCGGFASVTQMCRQRSATLEPCCVVKLHVDAKLKQGVCMHGMCCMCIVG